MISVNPGLLECRAAKRRAKQKPMRTRRNRMTIGRLITPASSAAREFRSTPCSFRLLLSPRHEFSLRDAKGEAASGRTTRDESAEPLQRRFPKRWHFPTHRNLRYVRLDRLSLHARYHIIVATKKETRTSSQSTRGNSLLYSPGNEIKIVATVAIRRIGES